MCGPTERICNHLILLLFRVTHSVTRQWPVVRVRVRVIWATVPRHCRASGSCDRWARAGTVQVLAGISISKLVG